MSEMPRDGCGQVSFQLLGMLYNRCPAAAAAVAGLKARVCLRACSLPLTQKTSTCVRRASQKCEADLLGEVQLTKPRQTQGLVGPSCHYVAGRTASISLPQPQLRAAADIGQGIRELDRRV
jgi:hypothetical protein